MQLTFCQRILKGYTTMHSCDNIEVDKRFVDKMVTSEDDCVMNIVCRIGKRLHTMLNISIYIFCLILYKY
jgi:hypothetical protein